jgi:hypothetical protein
MGKIVPLDFIEESQHHATQEHEGGRCDHGNAIGNLCMSHHSIDGKISLSKMGETHKHHGGTSCRIQRSYSAFLFQVMNHR